jgi:hypothetical protein
MSTDLTVIIETLNKIERMVYNHQHECPNGGWTKGPTPTTYPEEKCISFD